MIRPRSKPRPGRLNGDELEALRAAVFARDFGICQICERQTQYRLHSTYDLSYHMAHIHAKRNGGDSLKNCHVECGYCHRAYHSYGPSRIKPVPRKVQP